MRLKIKSFWLFLILSTCGVSVSAQHFSFSQDPEKFHTEVAEGLRKVGDEAVDKIASDLTSNWSRFTPEQKTMTMEIAQKMRKMRLPTRPHFTRYFLYLTYAVEQAGVTGDQLTTVLQINKDLLAEANGDQLLKFYTDLAYLFGRSWLYRHHYNNLKFENGSFDFEYIATAASAPDFDNLPEEDPLPIEEEIITEEEFAEEEDDGWGNDSWGDTDESDDSWATDDTWSDPSSWGNDTWGTTEEADPWADTGWGDDPWAEEEEAGSQEQSSGWTQEEEDAIFNNDNAHLAEVDIDLVAQLINDDITPPKEGALIHFHDIDMSMSSIYDSIGINNANGTLIMKERLFIGESGTVAWPAEIPGMDGVEVDLEQYHLKTNTPYIKAVKSKLRFGQFFEGDVDGFFVFKSVKRRRGRDPATYPKFKSHHSDVELTIPAERLKYTGGIALAGSVMTGESVSGKKSTVEVLDGKGRSFIAQSTKFEFRDSLIHAENASIVIYHDQDSIFHPAVKFTYNYGKSRLILQKEEGGFKNTNYHSSFFKMDFNADMIEWDLKSDSMDISILNAGNLVPAVFESHDYFHKNRLIKLSGIYGFNPLVAVVNYAKKTKSPSFYVAELAGFYDTRMDVMKGAMMNLWQFGFIEYEPQTGQILVKHKADHYYQSNMEKKDFDNLIIPSLINSSANATFKLDSSQLTVRGVERVLLTTDQHVYMEPDSQVVTILKGRDLKFDGMVASGDFQYKGKDFVFSYNDFIMDMPIIDSIHIEIPVIDTLAEGGISDEKTTLHNHLNETSGTLYINDPKNKSGGEELMKYPYFVSTSPASVYFDSPEVLDGAYNKSVRFYIPPFEMDSLDRGDLSHIAFEGTFYAGGILEPIDERLTIQPDNSLGFVHKIPESGYNLYGGEGKIYNELNLSNEGLRSDGRIDYLTTSVSSDDFIFYLDSTSAIGSHGSIDPGTLGEGSYPQADFGKFKMQWLPQKDSMYIANIGPPINFYDSSATLDGEVNVTATGVFGGGTLLTRGSEAISDELAFQENDFSARHANFKVLTEDPEKPAMDGEDISIEFDLIENVAQLSPERLGVPSIGFPYAQMKTSITSAVWDLQDSIVTMSKPPAVPIEDSYFYTTRPELDSLVFNATDAVYDINTFELNIEGIPYIIVADAKITPEGGKTTILENAELTPFENATLVIDTLNEYHNLFDGDIKILSRNQFIGSATYQLVNAANDSFNIKFKEFNLQDVPIAKNKTQRMTVSGGSIVERENVIISPGFYFKGDATMYANREALQLEGYVQAILNSRTDYDYWISYTHDAESPEVQIDVSTALTDGGQIMTAGLFTSARSGEVYMAFLDDRRSFDDQPFFKPTGLLQYNLEGQQFKIEPANKTSGESYAGTTFLFNDNSNTLIFEGPVQFLQNNENFNVNASALGAAKPDSGLYTIDAMMAFNMELHPEITDAMISDVLDVIERLGAPIAHTNEADEIYKLADLIGDQGAKTYERRSERDYVPFHNASQELDKTIVISNVDMAFSKDHNAWYNTSQIGLSNIYRNDINGMVDGFMEFKKDNDGGDVVNLFLQISPASWYYFNYEGGRLLMFSSNGEFNTVINERSDVAKAGFGKYTTVVGDQSETLSFINRFRQDYFGITEPYNLSSPDDIFLDDESFDTIDKDKDKDGFGF
ncbi:MAG: hypothetical protein RIF33_23910 [Cyclobacteriaceae bacterium]